MRSRALWSEIENRYRLSLIPKEERQMGAFAGMNDATRGYTSNYLLPAGNSSPGKYVVRIDECVSFEKEGVGKMWKNSLTILAVEQGPHKIGEDVQTFFKLDPRYPKMFYGKIMSFIAGVLGVADSEVNEDETDEVLSDKNPLLGLVCLVTATASPSKKQTNEDGSPKMFTNYSWGEFMDDDEIEAAIGEYGMERFFPEGF